METGNNTTEKLEDLSLSAAVRKAIYRALEETKGNKRKAARLLRIGKTTLYRRLREYEIADGVIAARPHNGNTLHIIQS